MCVRYTEEGEEKQNLNNGGLSFENTDLSG